MRVITSKRATTERFHNGPLRWLAVLCIACVAVACKAVAPTSTPPLASLRIEVLPSGAAVYVNGEEKGHTPLTLHLPPGLYTVRVQHEGYDSMQRDVELLAAEQTLIAEALPDAAPPIITLSELPGSVEAGQSILIYAQARDNETVMLMRLLIDGQLAAEATGQALEHVWDTQDAGTGTHTIAIRASDSAGNTGQATRSVDVRVAALQQPSPTPEPSTSTSTDISVYETTVTLPTYPYEPHLRKRVDARYNFKVTYLDRAAYEATSPRPQPRTFKAVVLENRYLKLTFLPELGGRLYTCTFKPSGQNIFYQNTVLKPSYWGPLSREENWWLAAGGMEWALPVHEHGYEWGLPWTYSIEQQPHQVSIMLRDSTANDRLRAEITVTLPAERAYFELRPRLVNPTAQAVACQLWLNAALTLGSASVSANTEFIYPTDSMIVHSSGDRALPAERQIMSWPIYEGCDLSHYRNWHNWLGVFVPDIQQDYAGAYNHDTELGIVRVFPPEVAPGLKLFAFGADFSAREEYSDDESEYFEMWAGPCRTFWPEDDVLIGAGQSLSWSEIWLPFSSIAGLDRANAEAVVKASVQGKQVHLGIAVSKARQVQFNLEWNGHTFHRQRAHLAPDMSLAVQVPLPSGARLPGYLNVQLQDENGAILLEYTKAIS